MISLASTTSNSTINDERKGMSPDRRGVSPDRRGVSPDRRGVSPETDPQATLKKEDLRLLKEDTINGESVYLNESFHMYNTPV